jgi:cbb3-type cytochrome oxidase subunit 1
MDLNHLFVRYPRSPENALACMLIPLYSFYGLPSTYRIIGSHYLHDAKGVEKQGKWIHGLAVPLILILIVNSLLNRVISRSTGETNPALLLSSAVVEMITYCLFLTLCIYVSQGLKHLSLANAASMTLIANEEWSRINNEAASNEADRAAL